MANPATETLSPRTSIYTEQKDVYRIQDTNKNGVEDYGDQPAISTSPRTALLLEWPGIKNIVRKVTPPFAQTKGSGLNHSGGGVTGERIDCSKTTVNAYAESFKKNILSMHPVVEANVLDTWIQEFLAGNATQPITNLSNESRSDQPRGTKRKRSSRPGGHGQQEKPGRPKDLVHTALVLTILALGKICLRRDDYKTKSGSGLNKTCRIIPGLEYMALADEAFKEHLRRDATQHQETRYTRTCEIMKSVYVDVFAACYYGQLVYPSRSHKHIHRASEQLLCVLRP